MSDTLSLKDITLELLDSSSTLENPNQFTAKADVQTMADLEKTVLESLPAAKSKDQNLFEALKAFHGKNKWAAIRPPRMK